jgi:hypothetical protein
MGAVVAILWNAASSQGRQHHGLAHLRQPGDLAGGWVPASVELGKVGFAPLKGAGFLGLCKSSWQGIRWSRYVKGRSKTSFCFYSQIQYACFLREVAHSHFALNGGSARFVSHRC